MTDSIADFLTRIRNAQSAGNSEVRADYSKMKENIAKVMKKNDFIKAFEIDKSGKFAQIKVTLADKKISLKKVSKPGQRIYVASNDIRKVLNGLGIAIVSTSKGVITGYEARSLNVGGELICEIY
jgi:small subunit ribosomal protein S8